MSGIFFIKERKFLAVFEELKVKTKSFTSNEEPTLFSSFQIYSFMSFEISELEILGGVC